MPQTNYQSSGVDPNKDGDKIRSLLRHTPRYDTLTLAVAAENPASFEGWFHGAFAQGGELQAIAAVSRSNLATIYGEETSAIHALADSMARAAGTRTSTGGTHRLFGVRSVIDTFWERFQSVNRTVVGDQVQALISASTAPKPKALYSVAPAVPTDIHIVDEYCAVHSLEQWGMDPRRVSKAQHEAHCKSIIADGSALVGRQRGKPVFYAEQQKIEDETVMLSTLYVPKPFQRPRVLQGVLGNTLSLLLEQSNKEVLAFVETRQTAWTEAASQVGFESKSQYRLISLR